MNARILIADDEKPIREVVKQYFSKFGYRIDTASNASEALVLMDACQYDVVITDKNMPDKEGNIEAGMQVLEYARENLPNTEVVMITGFATVETAVDAMKLGAFDYVSKPVPLQELKEKIDRILEYKQFINSKHALHTYRHLLQQVLEIIGKNTDLPPDQVQKRLRQLGSQIDQLFGVQKEYETIIQTQSEALKKIAENVEYLDGAIEEDSPYFEVVETIRDEARKSVW